MSAPLTEPAVGELLGGAALYRSALDGMRIWVARNDATGRAAVLNDTGNGTYGLIAVLALDLLPSGDARCGKERMRIASRDRATLEALARELGSEATIEVHGDDASGLYFLEPARSAK